MSPWTAPVATRSGRVAGTLLALATCGGRLLYARRLARTSSGTAPGVHTDDGVLLHVEVDGPVEAPLTVVFTHGFSVDMDEHAAQRSFLRDDFRLVFFDHRGHGRSGWGGHQLNTIPQLGRDLGRVIDECSGRGPVVIVGHSLGGMALMALARSRPELFGSRVVGAALLSTSAGRLTLGLPPGVARIVFESGLLRALLLLVWFVAPLTDRLTPLRTRIGRRVFRDRLFGADPPPQHLVTQLAEKWTNTSRSVAAAFYPQMVGHDTSPSLSVLAEIPVLVLTGDADTTISPRHSDRIATALGSRARLVRVPRAGHMVNMTHASAVNEELLGLLRDVARGTGRLDLAAGRAEAAVKASSWSDDEHRERKRT